MLWSPSLTGEQRERGTGPSQRPSCRGLRAAQPPFKGELLGGDSYQKMAGNLVSSWWVEVSYLTSVYVDVEGWVSMIRKHEQQ